MKRYVMIGVALLAAGAVLSVAVAWSCALWSKRGVWMYADVTPRLRAWWSASAPPGARSQVVLSRTSRGPGIEYEIVTGIDPDSGITVQPQHDDEGRYTGTVFIRAPGPRQPAAGAWDQAERLSAGWPLAVVGGERWHVGLPIALRPGGSVGGPSAGAVYAATLPIGDNARAAAPRLLPLRPRWPALAASSALYAVVLALAVWGLAALRRALRTNRDRCPACGYPVGSSPVCTECGARVAV